LNREIKTTSAQVASILKEAIFSGELVPGIRLREIEIQRSLNVSRSPIREAFKELQAEGLLTLRPNKGVIVTKLTEKDLKEVYELRILIESHAIRSACEIMTDDDLKEMRAMIEKEKDAIESEDPLHYLEISHGVHECYISKCDNSRLLNLFKILTNSMLAVHILTCSHKDRTFTTKSVEWHKRILSEISKRDANQAEVSLKKHLLMGREKLIYLLRKQEEMETEENLRITKTTSQSKQLVG
jgi:DNA-binding GntR family transcriptional regulator